MSLTVKELEKYPKDFNISYYAPDSDKVSDIKLWHIYDKKQVFIACDVKVC